MTAFPPLPKKHYEIIYADPPWQYNNRTYNLSPTETTWGALDHYSTVATDDLKTLNVARLINPRSCLLFMWAASPLLNEAIGLLLCVVLFSTTSCREKNHT